MTTPHLCRLGTVVVVMSGGYSACSRLGLTLHTLLAHPEVLLMVNPGRASSWSSTASTPGHSLCQLAQPAQVALIAT